MAITEKRPTAGECPCPTSIQRLHKRPAYSPGHAHLCVHADDLAVATQSTDFARSVGPYVISCQIFVKSEFPLDSALVCDSDKTKFGWHFFCKL